MCCLKLFDPGVPYIEASATNAAYHWINLSKCVSDTQVLKVLNNYIFIITCLYRFSSSSSYTTFSTYNNNTREQCWFLQKIEQNLNYYFLCMIVRLG